MRKETKIILVLLAMALIVGCNSGCDGAENIIFNDEEIYSLLHSPQGWVAQEDDYTIAGEVVHSLRIIEFPPPLEGSTVIIRGTNGKQISSGVLQKNDEGYLLLCGLGECTLKVSANSSKESIDLTLTNEKDNKYYFALSNGDT